MVDEYHKGKDRLFWFLYWTSYEVIQGQSESKCGKQTSYREVEKDLGEVAEWLKATVC